MFKSWAARLWTQLKFKNVNLIGTYNQNGKKLFEKQFSGKWYAIAKSSETFLNRYVNKKFLIEDSNSSACSQLNFNVNSNESNKLVSLRIANEDLYIDLTFKTVNLSMANEFKLLDFKQKYLPKSLKGFKHYLLKKFTF